MTEGGKDAISHLEDPGATFDAATAPATVRMPGHGKDAQHVDRHTADRKGSTVKHVGHTRKPLTAPTHGGRLLALWQPVPALQPVGVRFNGEGESLYDTGCRYILPLHH